MPEKVAVPVDDCCTKKQWLILPANFRETSLLETSLDNAASIQSGSSVCLQRTLPENVTDIPFLVGISSHHE